MIKPRPLLRLCTLALLVLLPACAAWRPAPAVTPERMVLLISVDGFRADYLERGLTPNMKALADRGVRGVMRPAFPSKTFPNHYTLVTGLRPDRHGLVDNVMRDPLLPGRTFRLGDRAEVTDPVWWEEGEPLWVTAERAGMQTAVLFWPGSEAPVRGVQPSLWMAFDQSMTAEARADQMLAWLDGAGQAKPGLLALYFDEVDTYGHWHGPDAGELDAALERTDAAIGRLVEGLAARGLLARTDIVVVADHGMAPTSRARIIDLDALVSREDGEVLTSGVHLAFQPTPERRREVEAALLRAHDHMECWRKGEMPDRFAYGRHRRVPEIFCLAEPGWEILPRAVAEARPQVGGAHGYDPAHPTMAAVFIAAGPRIAAGVALPRFDNVDVYPFLAGLLGLGPADHDGNPATLRAVLKP